MELVGGDGSPITHHQLHLDQPDGVGVDKDEDFTSSLMAAFASETENSEDSENDFTVCHSLAIEHTLQMQGFGDASDEHVGNGEVAEMSLDEASKLFVSTCRWICGYDDSDLDDDGDYQFIVPIFPPGTFSDDADDVGRMSMDEPEAEPSPEGLPLLPVAELLSPSPTSFQVTPSSPVSAHVGVGSPGGPTHLASDHHIASSSGSRSRSRSVRYSAAYLTRTGRRGVAPADTDSE